jgi:hypothetical protein
VFQADLVGGGSEGTTHLSSPIRSRSGLVDSSNRDHSSHLGKYHQFLHPTKEHRAVPAKIAGDDIRQLSLSCRFVNRLPLLVNLPSVLCSLKHPLYPPTWPGYRTFVVPLSSTGNTSLEYCNLQHDSHPPIPQYEILKSRSGGRRALAFFEPCPRSGLRLQPLLYSLSWTLRMTYPEVQLERPDN